MAGGSLNESLESQAQLFPSHGNQSSQGGYIRERKAHRLASRPLLDLISFLVLILVGASLVHKSAGSEAMMPPQSGLVEEEAISYDMSTSNPVLHVPSLPSMRTESQTPKPRSGREINVYRSQSSSISVEADPMIADDNMEQKVIELCRFSDTPLCQLYFELYNRIEAMPEVKAEMGNPDTKSQMESNYGHKIESTPRVNATAVSNSLEPTSNATHSNPQPRKQTQRHESQFLEGSRDKEMRQKEESVSRMEDQEVVYHNIAPASDFYNASAEARPENKSWIDPQGLYSRLSEVRVLPPDGFQFSNNLLPGPNPHLSLQRRIGQSQGQSRKRTKKKKISGKAKKQSKFSNLISPGKKTKLKEADRRHGSSHQSTPNFPTYDSIPSTRFSCEHQREGYHADPEAYCQVYHYCHYDGRQDSFMCPKGTIFNQEVLVCDWWYNADCGTISKALYHRERNHKQPSTHSSQFPISTTFTTQASHGHYEPVALQGNVGDDFDLTLLTQLREAALPPPTPVSVGPIQAQLLRRPVARPFPTAFPGRSNPVWAGGSQFGGDDYYPVAKDEDFFTSSFKQDIEESIAKIKAILEQRHAEEGLDLSQEVPNPSDDHPLFPLTLPIIGPESISDISVNTVESDYYSADNEDIEAGSSGTGIEDYYYYDEPESEDLAYIYPDERSFSVARSPSKAQSSAKLRKSRPQGSDPGFSSLFGTSNGQTGTSHVDHRSPSSFFSQETPRPPFISSEAQPLRSTSSPVAPLDMDIFLSDLFQYQHVVDTEEASQPPSKAGFDALLATLKPKHEPSLSPQIEPSVMEEQPQSSQVQGTEKKWPTSLSQLVGLTMEKISAEEEKAAGNRRNPTQAQAVMKPPVVNVIAGSNERDPRLSEPSPSRPNVPMERGPAPALGHQQSQRYTTLVEKPNREVGLPPMRRLEGRLTSPILSGRKDGPNIVSVPHAKGSPGLPSLEQILRPGPNAVVPTTLELQKLLLHHHKNKMLARQQQKRLHQQKQLQQQKQQLQQQQQQQQFHHQSGGQLVSLGQFQPGQAIPRDNWPGLLNRNSRPATGRGSEATGGDGRGQSLSFSTSASIGVGLRRMGNEHDALDPSPSLTQFEDSDWRPAPGYPEQTSRVDIMETQKETLAQLQSEARRSGPIEARKTIGGHELVVVGEGCYLVAPNQELRLLGTKGDCDLDHNHSVSTEQSLISQPNVGPTHIAQATTTDRPRVHPRRPKNQKKVFPRPSNRNKLSPQESAIWRTLKSLPILKDLMRSLSASRPTDKTIPDSRRPILSRPNLE